MHAGPSLATSSSNISGGTLGKLKRDAGSSWRGSGIRQGYREFDSTMLNHVGTHVRNYDDKYM